MNNILIQNRATLEEVGLNFRRFGYFTRPMDAGSFLRRPSVANRHWLQLEILINRLKSGDFSATEAVLRLCRETEDWRIKEAATRVLGHVGSVDCFKLMREELEQHPLRKQEHVNVASRELVLLYCRAFALWGRLDVLPVLMDQYLTLRLKKTPEISLLPLLMADLLVDDESSMIAHEPPEDKLEDYLNLVMNRYDDVVSAHGSDKVLVFRGELYSVFALAERMRHLNSSYPSTELVTLRERFEPASGVDCSRIFLGERVSPLEAAAIAESFLDADESRRMSPGKRWFFGHQVQP